MQEGQKFRVQVLVTHADSHERVAPGLLLQVLKTAPVCAEARTVNEAMQVVAPP